MNDQNSASGLTPEALAQEIRRVDGNHTLGAGALAEALFPFIRASRADAPPPVDRTNLKGYEAAPERIFLNTGYDAEDFKDMTGEDFKESEVTWCTESVDEGDVEYVRIDKHNAALAEMESMRNGVQTDLLAADAPPRGEAPVKCFHEPYQGNCIHCGVQFVNGFPRYPASPPPALPVAQIVNPCRYMHVVGFKCPGCGITGYDGPPPAPALSEGLTERENIRRENYRDSSAALKSLIGMFRLWEMSEPKHPGDAIEQREKFRAYVNKVEAEMDARDARLSPAAPLEGEKA